MNGVTVLGVIVAALLTLGVMLLGGVAMAKGVMAAAVLLLFTSGFMGAILLDMLLRNWDRKGGRR